MVWRTPLLLLGLLTACGDPPGSANPVQSDAAEVKAGDASAADTTDAGSQPKTGPDSFADGFDANACASAANYCVGNDVYACEAGKPKNLGACPPSSCCTGAGVCAADTCEPTSCAPNACGTPCTCAYVNAVCTAGKCACTPNCTAKVCGDDGCGGACGAGCGAGMLCKAGTCVSSVCGFDGPAALTLAQAQLATQAFVSMVAATDGGAIVTGQDSSGVYLMRYGVDGKAIWQLAQPDLYLSAQAVATPGGVVMSFQSVDGPETDAARGVLRSFDQAGKLQWTHTYPESLPGTFFPNALVRLANGDLVQLGTDTIAAESLEGGAAYHAQWIRTDATGKLLNAEMAKEVSVYSKATAIGDDFVAIKSLVNADTAELPKGQLLRVGAKPWVYELPNNAAAMGVVAVSQADVVAAIVDHKTGVDAGNYSLLRLDQNGAKVWQVNFGKRYLDPIVALPSGDVVLAVTDADFFNPADHVTLARVGPTGTLVWFKEFAQKPQTEVIAQVLALGPLGHLVLLGARQPVKFKFGEFDKVSGFLINVNGDGATGCP